MRGLERRVNFKLAGYNQRGKQQKVCKLSITIADTPLTQFRYLPLPPSIPTYLPPSLSALSSPYLPPSHLSPSLPPSHSSPSLPLIHLPPSLSFISFYIHHNFSLLIISCSLLYLSGHFFFHSRARYNECNRILQRRQQRQTINKRYNKRSNST